MHHYHMRRVYAMGIEVGYLVLQLIVSTKRTNKLALKWEGSYPVVQATRPGAVRLDTKDGTLVLNLWNIEHLRKFYTGRAAAGLPGDPDRKSVV